MSATVESEMLVDGCFSDAAARHVPGSYRMAYYEVLEEPFFSKYCPTLRALSHALANLSMPIGEYPRLLQKMLAADSAVSDIMEQLTGATDQLDNLNRELVRLCHGLEGKPVPIDLGALVQEVVHALVDEFQARSLPAIYIEADLDAVCLRAPNEALHHLVRDLCVSIWTVGDSQRLRIKVGRFVLPEASLDAGIELMPGRYVALQFSADGRAPSAQEWADLFNPFSQCLPHSGYGLGLSAVYRTVRHLQGTFLHQIEDRQGTDILILFPEVAE